MFLVKLFLLSPFAELLKVAVFDGGLREVLAGRVTEIGGAARVEMGPLVGARVVLLNYLLPRDVLQAMAKEQVTGLTAVPPLYIQLTQMDWPAEIGEHLRYFANTGGRMPRETLQALRRRVPSAKPFLMYGLTEAFRSTFLDPALTDSHPTSMGKAIPFAEILVINDAGEVAADDEEGELVHCGPLVAQGYWQDAERTALRFKAAPAESSYGGMAVFSGDRVKRDADGLLYFAGRRDAMNPVELLLSALAACMLKGIERVTPMLSLLTSIQRWAQKKSLLLPGMRPLSGVMQVSLMPMRTAAAIRRSISKRHCPITRIRTKTASMTEPSSPLARTRCWLTAIAMA